MDRRQFLAASSVGIAATVAGCLDGVLTSSPDEENGETNVGAAGESGPDREITVSADGEVETEPNEASVSVGVEASGDAAEDVRDELAAGADRLRETFDDLELPEENVEEGRYRVTPVPDRAREEGEPAVRGTHSFDVTIDNVDRVGEVIDGAVDAGADDIGRVDFTVDEETREDLRRDAIDEALATADAEAEHVAANRGVELTGTTSVTTSDVRVHSVRHDVATEALEADDAAAPSTEIDADPVSVSASVTVTYSFSA